MPYTEVTFLIEPVDPWRDVLMTELADIGYDSFEEGPDDPKGGGELRGYVRSDRFDAGALRQLLALRDPHVQVSWQEREIPDRNWNAEWERSFQPVEVGHDVRIRADFHPAAEGFTHELIITPRMAFGTGHHATTRMMVQAMLDLVIREKEICDLGCGTGVLAILAERMGARHCDAFDIDPAAVDNARANVERNGCVHVVCATGVADALVGRSYDVILANIERNVLLDAMPLLSAAMKPGAALLLSGFVVTDRHMLAQRAREHGLELAERMNEGDWALLGCRKPRNSAQV